LEGGRYATPVGDEPCRCGARIDRNLFPDRRIAGGQRIAGDVGRSGGAGDPRGEPCEVQ
jgi:hypothetical protein